MRLSFSMLLGLCLLGCDAGSADLEPLPFPTGTPVIAGIELIDEQDQYIGTYGTPQRPVPTGSVVCEGTAFDGAEPWVSMAAPSLGQVFGIRYQTPCATRVRVWIVRGRGPGEPPPNPVAQGAVGPVRALARSVTTARLPVGGEYSQIIDARVLGLPDGFYRVYFDLGGYFTWTDVWVTDPSLLF